MAFGKTIKKKQNAAGKIAVPETALPVAGSKARRKKPGTSAAVEGVVTSAPLKVARTVQMTSVAASSHNPAADQSIIAPVRTMAATAGTQSVETAPPVANLATESYLPAYTSSRRPSQEEISHRAYLYWAERGFQHGFADEDWARAEADLTR